MKETRRRDGRIDSLRSLLLAAPGPALYFVFLNCQAVKSYPDTARMDPLCSEATRLQTKACTNRLIPWGSQLHGARIPSPKTGIHTQGYVVSLQVERRPNQQTQRVNVSGTPFGKYRRPAKTRGKHANLGRSCTRPGPHNICRP